MKLLTFAAALVVTGMAALAAPAFAQKTKECGALPAPYAGVAFAGDGDTIVGVSPYPAIRLWGMNAPELRDAQKGETVPGMKARALVADLLAAAGHKVACQPIEWDGYCRIVASCATATGVDLTRAVLEAGLAYGFYLGKHPDRIETAIAYSTAEAAARKERRGLWKAWLGEQN